MVWYLFSGATLADKPIMLVAFKSPRENVTR